MRETQVAYRNFNPWIRFVKRPAGKWLVANRWVGKPTASEIVETVPGSDQRQGGAAYQICPTELLLRSGIPQ